MLTLVVIGVLAGAVTAVSPCVLPVLPAVFFGAGSFARPGPTSAFAEPIEDGRPRTVTVARRSGPVRIVLGLVLSFAVLTLLGSLLMNALRLPADVLRWGALVVLFVVGLGLVSPPVQRILQRPFQRLPHIDPTRAGGPFLLGLALGALYVPCAGPVLAVIAMAGGTGRVNAGILILTMAFSVGTAAPLLLFAWAGHRIGVRAPGFRTGARRFRVIGGTVMMALAVALTFNLTDGLQRSVPTYTAAIQHAVEGNTAAQQALQQLAASVPRERATAVPASGPSGPVVTCESAADLLANCGPAPAFVDLDSWINTQAGAAVTVAGLRGKVVLVDFWTFSCINCQHVLPYVTSWYDKYRDYGLEVIGVHTPEFSFERDASSVRAAVAKAGIHYPVGLDNSSATWRSYGNSYWPAAYLVDATGTLRYVKFGEGDYQHTELLIRQLLLAAHPSVSLPDPTRTGS